MSAVLRFYRVNSGPLSFAVNSLCLLLLWCLLPLENEFYAHLRRHKRFYFPQVDFARLRPLDPLRILLQVIYLFFFVQESEKSSRRLGLSLGRSFNSFKIQAEHRLIALLKTTGAALPGSHRERLHKLKDLWQRLRQAQIVILGTIACLAALLALWCITQPLELFYQFVFLSLMLEIAVILKRFGSKYALLLMIVISIIISSRYMFWRYTETLNLSAPGPALCSLLLILAESYAFLVMLLGYFQIGWTLDRKPIDLPADEASLPTVDIYIPTYNEPLEVVRPTVLCALALDWPQNKLRVYILDDGSRSEFRDFAHEIGAGYIIRKVHDHAKAGNINHALTKTQGEFIAIFDCDHIPVRSFLMMTLGYMVRDPKIALVQTPHHFYSEDPFERNLGLLGKIPQENSLFHDFIQKGNDLHDATMFCGSCAVIRRSALEEVGGIAVETVTEDAHTSLRLSRRGYKTAFIGIPLAAGLSTETLSAHVSQRIRWARGMIQIFRIDNPLTGPGLTLGQRLCYLNAMLHFLHGIPRIIFLLAPLPFMFFDVYVIYAQALALLAYVLPHMVHSTLANQTIQRGYRFPFWSGVYEAVLSWYIALPTFIALFFPKLGKFNVTAKGGRIEDGFFDWFISRPYLLLIILNLAGLVMGAIKLLTYENPEYLSIAVNAVWIVYNLMILGATIAIASEARQVRRHPRVALSLPVSLKAEGAVLAANLINYSQQGVALKFQAPLSSRGLKLLAKNNEILLILNRGSHAQSFKAVVRSFNVPSRIAGVELCFPDIKTEQEFYECTFCRADTWSLKSRSSLDESLTAGFLMILHFAVTGYQVMIRSLPGPLRLPIAALTAILNFIVSLMPRALHFKTHSRMKNYA